MSLSEQVARFSSYSINAVSMELAVQMFTGLISYTSKGSSSRNSCVLVE